MLARDTSVSQRTSRYGYYRGICEKALTNSFDPTHVGGKLTVSSWMAVQREQRQAHETNSLQFVPVPSRHIQRDTKTPAVETRQRLGEGETVQL